VAAEKHHYRQNKISSPSRRMPGFLPYRKRGSSQSNCARISTVRAVVDRWSGGGGGECPKDRGLLPNCRSFIDGLGGKEQRRLRSWEGGGTGEDGGVGVGRSGLFGFAHEARRSLRCSRGSTHMRGPGAWTGAARRPRRALRAVGACVSSPRRLAGPPRRQAKKHEEIPLSACLPKLGSSVVGFVR
jgi:hypothetical protein